MTVVAIFEGFGHHLKNTLENELFLPFFGPLKIILKMALVTILLLFLAFKGDGGDHLKLGRGVRLA